MRRCRTSLRRQELRLCGPLAGHHFRIATTGGIAIRRHSATCPCRGKNSIYSSTGRVPDAAVLLRNAETGKREIVRTDDAGEFQFAGVPGGRYSMEVSKPGFQLFRQPDMLLASGSAQTMSVVLNMGKLSETLNITAPGNKPARPAAAGAQPQRIRVGGSVQHAKVLKMVRPSYPVHLKEAGIEGTVLLQAVIGRDGGIIDVQTLNSLVHPDFVQSAIEAVQQWLYEPTLLNGNPVEIVTDVTVNFTLAK